MSFIDINQLKERITLLSIQSSAGVDGREIRTARIVGHAWAQITSQPRLERLMSVLTAVDRPRHRALYKVVVRAMLAKKLHQKIQAVQWGKQRLVVLEPFVPHPHAPRYWQAFCTEDQEKIELDEESLKKDETVPLFHLDMKQRGTCQKKRNEDNMKYRKRFIAKIKSKQNVNVHGENDPELREKRREKVGSQGEQNREEGDHAKN